MIAMKHPNIFRSVASFNAPLDFEAMRKTGFAKIIAENPHGIKLATSHDKRLFTPSFLAMAAAFSPDLNRPPDFLDLPFDYPSTEIIPSVWRRWLQHDPATLAKNYVRNLKKINIYIAVDESDEFGITMPVEKFHQTLLHLGVEHKFLLYPGTHTSLGSALKRLQMMLEFLSSCLQNPY